MSECPCQLRSAKIFAKSRLVRWRDIKVSVLGDKVQILAEELALVEVVHQYFAERLGPEATVHKFSCSFEEFYCSKHAVSILFDSGHACCTMRNHQAAKMWTCEEKGPVVGQVAACFYRSSTPSTSAPSSPRTAAEDSGNETANGTPVEVKHVVKNTFIHVEIICHESRSHEPRSQSTPPPSPHLHTAPVERFERNWDKYKAMS